jgi:c-di-GMP-binding flagellar brake protein YcgR
MFLDTQPMEIDASSGATIDEFRVSAPAELRSLLKRLLDGNVLVNLNASDGTAYTTTIWTLDHARGVLTLAADVSDPRLQRLLDADEVIVVAYLESIKLQFELDSVVLVHGARSSVLQAPCPRTMYRFQRRSSYRVRPLPRAAPVARMPHPAQPGQTLGLRIIDVSLGGCALLLPDGGPALAPGAELGPVTIELDADTRFETWLKLHHVTALNPDAGGVRLGCSLVKLPAESERALQRYIDQTQKRRRMMSLE